ncbi:hypothetical protein [Shewanella psychrophila]|uniref:hypothetical protein n=1 Tax=Shewanella psychrophila TaxID=225848 RepID=UPI00098AA1C3|nr:hypothetical protein [Shewanella psychrophila]
MPCYRLCALSSTLVTSPSIAAGYGIWVYPLHLDQQTSIWQLGVPKPVSNCEGYYNQPEFSAVSPDLKHIAIVWSRK